MWVNRYFWQLLRCEHTINIPVYLLILDWLDYLEACRMVVLQRSDIIHVVGKDYIIFAAIQLFDSWNLSHWGFLRQLVDLWLHSWKFEFPYDTYDEKDNILDDKSPEVAIVALDDHIIWLTKDDDDISEDGMRLLHIDDRHRLDFIIVQQLGDNAHQSLNENHNHTGYSNQVVRIQNSSPILQVLCWILGDYSSVEEDWERSPNSVDACENAEYAMKESPPLPITIEGQNNGNIDPRTPKGSHQASMCSSCRPKYCVLVDMIFWHFNYLNNILNVIINWK